MNPHTQTPVCMLLIKPLKDAIFKSGYISIFLLFFINDLSQSEVARLLSHRFFTNCQAYPINHCPEHLRGTWGHSFPRAQAPRTIFGIQSQIHKNTFPYHILLFGPFKIFRQMCSKHAILLCYRSRREPTSA